MISFLNKLFNRMKPVTAQPQKRGRKLWEPTSPVDWSRPALHIAVEQGVAVQTVISYMRRTGIPVRPRGVLRGQRLKVDRKVDPSTVDWRQQDTQLGLQYGVTREYMRQLRKKAGHPPSGSRAWRANGGVTVNPKGGRKP